MSRFPRLNTVSLLALAATLLVVGLADYRLTDGDSSLFAAIGHEMAEDGGGAWIAPHWAFYGSPALFYEHPPGGMWGTALFESLGLPNEVAALIANSVWLWLLFAALVWLGGGGSAAFGPGLGWLAAGVMLLSFPLWKYTVRAGIEIPFAACVTACVAASRSKSKYAPLALGLAFFGALVTRGVFAFAIPAFLIADGWLPPRRGFEARVRLIVGLLVGALLAAALDIAHALEEGHGFWNAYFEKQVIPSLAADGTPHPNEGATFLYYGGRLLLYGLPWWLVCFAGWRRVRRTEAWPLLSTSVRTALLWIVVFFVGVVLARRQGSRYLFAVWPALAWLTALLASHLWSNARAGTRLALARTFLVLVPALTLGKVLTAPEDDWVRDANLLREARFAAVEAGEEVPAVYGPFAGHDDRWKQFLRHHLQTWAFREPVNGAPSGSLLWVASSDPAYFDPDAWLRTPRFALLRVP